MQPTDHIIALRSQVYTGTTLKKEITAKLTALGYSHTINYDFNTDKISISISVYSFNCLTDNELKYPSPVWNGTTYDPHNLQSANEIIKKTLVEFHQPITTQFHINHILIYNQLETYISIHQLEIMIH